MNKSNLTQVKRRLSQAIYFCTKLKPFLGEIADAGRRRHAEALWLEVDKNIKKAKEEMMAWRIGYPKGQHRIKENQLEAIRQWFAAPHPKPKVRALARELEVSPTTVYAVLKELGWKKPKKG